MRARGASGLEGLDDDHAATAARTRMRERPRLSGISGVWVAGLVLRNRCIEQLARPRDVRGAGAVGEEAVVADAMEPGRQQVDEETADELVDRERHHLCPLTALGSIVLPFEGHADAWRRLQKA